MSSAENIRKSIDGWCSAEKLEATQTLLNEFKSNKGTIVEIGTWNGSWLLPVASSTTYKCIGIDPYSAGACIEGMVTQANIEWWNNEKMLEEKYNEILATIKYFELNNVEIIRSTSEEYVTQIKNNSISLFHSDANHSAEPTMRNVQLYLPKVKLGGIFIQDDVGWTEGGEETVRPAVNWLVNNGCEFIEEVSGAMFFRRIK